MSAQTFSVFAPLWTGVMLKLLPNFTSLGVHLKRERKARKLSQSVLAQQAQLSIDTLGLLEHGKGNLSSFWAALNILNLEIVGRNLPPGQHIGQRIITLRRRKEVSQRDLVKLVGVSQPTLIELEHHCTGRLHTLDRVLVALGAGAYLAPQGSTKAFYVHAGNSSTSENWETPKELLEPLYSVFGAFDLDPCSPCSNGRTAPVKAGAYFTQTDDGLSLPWFGTVFMNPPYNRSLHNWTAKAKAEVEQGNAGMVIGLLPARPDTKYWHRDVAGSASIFFLKGRLKFGNVGKPAPFPSCLAVWGGSDDLATKLQAAIPEAWLSR
jgi:transcriptional regulator with XRE-family HTH domain